jgi:hypothetical protein
VTAPNPLIDRLGAHIRSDQRDDAVFERVARGEATAEERARLERAAKAEADPALARRLEGSMPLDPVVADRIASHLAPKKGARVFPIGRVASPLALAAAALLFLSVGRRAELPLPEYAVAARGVEMERGPAEPGTRLSTSLAAGARFEIVLRPQTAPGTAMSVWAFTSDADADVRPLDATIDVSTAGAVRITGAFASLRSAREIVAVVAPASGVGRVGTAGEAARYAATRTGGVGVRVLVVPVDP